MKWTKIIIAGACVLATVGASYATVLYQEDFQSYANPTYNFVSASSGSSTNGWTGTGMLVNQTNSVGGVGSLFSSGAPTRSLYVSDTVSNNALNQMLIYSSTNGGATSISNNGNVKISFDFNIRSNQNSASQGLFPMFDLRGGAVTNVPNSWATTMSLMATTNHVFTYYTNGNNAVQIPGVTVSTANWYRVEIAIGDISTATDYFDLKVWEAKPADGYNQTGTLVIDLTNLLFRADVSYINGFDFRTITTNQAGLLYNIDNIKVETIPEPGAMSLLSLGAGGLILLLRHYSTSL